MTMQQSLATETPGEDPALSVSLGGRVQMLAGVTSALGRRRPEGLNRDGRCVPFEDPQPRGCGP
jgi:hypothetical protein